MRKKIPRGWTALAISAVGRAISLAEIAVLGTDREKAATVESIETLRLRQFVAKREYLCGTTKSEKGVNGEIRHKIQAVRP